MRKFTNYFLFYLIFIIDSIFGICQLDLTILPDFWEPFYGSDVDAILVSCFAFFKFTSYFFYFLEVYFSV